MSIKKASFATIIFILFSTMLSYAQEAKIIVNAPSQVSVGDEFIVRFVIQDAKDVTPAKASLDLAGAELISKTPSISTSMSTYFSGGEQVVERSVVLSYFFRAVKKGKYKIPRIEFIVDDDNSVWSDEFKIEVQSETDLKADKKIKEGEAFIKTIISKNNVNLDDTLTVTYRLYTTMDIRQIKDIYHPRTNDFYASIMPIYADGFKQEKIGKKEYNVIDIRKIVLQPRTLGEKQYPKGEAIIEFLIPTGRKQKDMRGNSYDEVILDTKKILLDSISVTVLDLVGL